MKTDAGSFYATTTANICARAHVFRSGGVGSVEWRGGVPSPANAEETSNGWDLQHTLTLPFILSFLPCV